MAVVLLFAALWLLNKCQHGVGPYSCASPSNGTGTSTSAAACPSDVAARLPDGSGSGAVLVQAYRTANKQITLCESSSGDLYYYGQFTGRPATGIAMPAQRTADGYRATNGPYTYEIAGSTVTILLNGDRIGTEHPTAAPPAEPCRPVACRPPPAARRPLRPVAWPYLGSGWEASWARCFRSTRNG